MQGMREAVGPFKITTPSGGNYVGETSLVEAIRKADTEPGSQVTGADKSVIYMSKKPETAPAA
jgi:hypothetical protein